MTAFIPIQLSVGIGKLETIVTDANTCSAMDHWQDPLSIVIPLCMLGEGGLSGISVLDSGAIRLRHFNQARR